MKIFFISDTHFGHANSIKFDKRPWRTVEDMDREMIRRWNAKVSPEDHVFIVGDFMMRSGKHVSYYTRQLNGVLHLIRGNHDPRKPQFESCFYEVCDYKDMKVNAFGKPRRVILSHYFMPFFNGAHRGAIMLHGHTHKSYEAAMEEHFIQLIHEKEIPCESYNVGAMWQHYEPMTLEEILLLHKKTEHDKEM